MRVIEIHIMQEQIDAAKVVGCDVDFLAIEAVQPPLKNLDGSIANRCHRPDQELANTDDESAFWKNRSSLSMNSKPIRPASALPSVLFPVPMRTHIRRPSSHL